MDFTFQSMGFAMGNSRASIDDVRSQLVVVKDELKTLQEKLAERDVDIKAIRGQLDQMMEMYEQAILDISKSAEEKDALKDQIQRLRSAWTAERDARKALEEKIDVRVDKERQLQAKLRRMSAQDSLSVLARARRPGGDGERAKAMDRNRRGPLLSPSLRGSFPFNQSSPRELEL
jgi:chromosome segregation ATPase